MKELREMSDEELDKYKLENRKRFFEAKQELDTIDRELTRRIPFVSYADDRRRNLPRSLNKTKCDFWDCENETTYSTDLRIGKGIVTIHACSEHTSVLYEQRYTVIGNSIIEKDGVE